VLRRCAGGVTAGIFGIKISSKEVKRQHTSTSPDMQAVTVLDIVLLLLDAMALCGRSGHGLGHRHSRSNLYSDKTECNVLSGGETTGENTCFAICNTGGWMLLLLRLIPLATTPQGEHTNRSICGVLFYNHNNESISWSPLCLFLASNLIIVALDSISLPTTKKISLYRYCIE
jgi:hypothetical protein